MKRTIRTASRHIGLVFFVLLPGVDPILLNSRKYRALPFYFLDARFRLAIAKINVPMVPPFRFSIWVLYFAPRPI